MIFKQIYLIYRENPKGMTSMGQSEPGNNGNKEVPFKFGAWSIAIMDAKIEDRVIITL